eukprot:TRINITY_DN15910_c0_g1_i1.p1 TRINITY_DN15910_c0_g1~~TRINITY_DN15910_c0_g1_i1.p1  ORF type:complete len:424 (+),score=113.87 TRINITY_DN15910_c0_g1_i1:50-1321(+)
MSSSGKLVQAFLQSWNRPDEISSMVRLKAAKSSVLRQEYENSPPQLKEAAKFCFDMLERVSRSFAAVIQQIGPELRRPICIFYLVLRGLDTVEDDTTVSKTQRVEIMVKFHEYIHQEGWKLDGYGEGDEKTLLQSFHHVVSIFKSLKPQYQKVITEITQRMANGMCEYLDITIPTLNDYDKYCHYVAGLVGIGLTQMFACSGLEDANMAKDETLSNSMGLFLQKTNIIRDYLEDALEDRSMWPQEVWGRYASRLEDFTKATNRKKAMECLNDLVTDALRHIPDCIKYMSQIKNQENFNFCAIPQVMAIATLSECFNNERVFEGVVKIRTGLSAKLMIQTRNMSALAAFFDQFLFQMKRKINNQDPNSKLTKERITIARMELLPYLPQGYKSEPSLIDGNAARLVILIAVFAGYYLYSNPSLIQ